MDNTIGEKFLQAKQEHKLSLVKEIRDVFLRRLGNVSRLRETAQFVDAVILAILEKEEEENRKALLEKVALNMSDSDLINILISRGFSVWGATGVK